MLCKAIFTLATCCPSWFDDLWIADATPVPCLADPTIGERQILAAFTHHLIPEGQILVADKG